jgi:hypothetical protein
MGAQNDGNPSAVLDGLYGVQLGRLSPQPTQSGDEPLELALLSRQLVITRKAPAEDNRDC